MATKTTFWVVIDPSGKEVSLSMAQSKDEAICKYISAAHGRQIDADEALKIWDGNPTELGYTCLRLAVIY
jgi:hypothetical protein